MISSIEDFFPSDANNGFGPIIPPPEASQRTILPGGDCLQIIDPHRGNWARLNAELDPRNFGRQRVNHLFQTFSEKIDPPAESPFRSYKAFKREVHDFRMMGSLLIHAGYSRVEDFVHCGLHGFKCLDRLFCPRCIEIMFRLRALIEFGSKISSDNGVYFMTVSAIANSDHTKRFAFRDIGSAELKSLLTHGNQEPVGSEYGLPFQNISNLTNWRICLNEIKTVVAQVTGRWKTISAASGAPEISVRFPFADNFNPRIIPHYHFVSWSPGLCRADALEIRTRIKIAFDRHPTICRRAYPSVAIYRLSTNEDLARVLAYNFKPISLPGAYLSAAQSIGEGSLEMEQLNRTLRTFVNLVPILFSHLPRIIRLGNCHRNGAGYFGNPIPKWLQGQSNSGVRRHNELAEDEETGAAKTKHILGSGNAAEIQKHFETELARSSSQPRRPRYIEFQKRNGYPPLYGPDY